jgi:hypothetical protein
MSQVPNLDDAPKIETEFDASRSRVENLGSGGCQTHLQKYLKGEQFESVEAYRANAFEDKRLGVQRLAQFDRNVLFLNEDGNVKVEVGGKSDLTLRPTIHALRQMLGRMNAGHSGRLITGNILTPDTVVKVLREIQSAHVKSGKNVADDDGSTGEFKCIVKRDHEGADTGILRGFVGKGYALYPDYDVLNDAEQYVSELGMVPGSPTFEWSPGMREQMGNKVAFSRDDMHSFGFWLTPDHLPGSDDFGGLRLGIGVKNSEVGAGSLGVFYTLCREVCCNFLMWGVAEAKMLKRRHVGKNVREWFHETMAEVASTEAAKRAAAVAVEQFNAAVAIDFVSADAAAEADAAPDAKSWDAVVRAYGKVGVGPKMARDAFTARNLPENQDAAPGHSLWRAINGLTALARDAESAEAASVIQTAAGKMLASATA